MNDLSNWLEAKSLVKKHKWMILWCMIIGGILSAIPGYMIEGMLGVSGTMIWSIFNILYSCYITGFIISYLHELINNDTAKLLENLKKSFYTVNQSIGQFFKLNLFFNLKIIGLVFLYIIIVSLTTHLSTSIFTTIISILIGVVLIYIGTKIYVKFLYDFNQIFFNSEIEIDDTEVKELSKKYSIIIILGVLFILFAFYGILINGMFQMIGVSTSQILSVPIVSLLMVIYILYIIYAVFFQMKLYVKCILDETENYNSKKYNME